jgi:hypothetical protein
MCSPDPLDRIQAQSLIVRRAIAEAQDIIAETIEQLERAVRAACPEAEHVERANPPFPRRPST